MAGIKIGKGAFAPPFIVMDVITAANARQAALPPGAPHIIRMEVGQPGTGAPAGATEAVIRALRDNQPMGYTEAFGLVSLRQRIATHNQAWYGLDIPISRIAVTVGASGAFPLAFLAAFDPGDRVAMATPFYPPYVNILTALGMEPVLLEAGPETRFQPTVEMLEKLDPRPHGLIVASPTGSTGYSFSAGGTKPFVQASVNHQSGTRSFLLDREVAAVGYTRQFTTFDFSLGTKLGSGMTVELFLQNAFDQRGQLSRNTACAPSICGANYRVYPVKPQLFGIKFGHHF